MWITPVTDRTALDVELKTDKAFLMHTDLLRIEVNSLYISEQLRVDGYSVSQDAYLMWNSSSIQYIEQLNRILDKIKQINNCTYGTVLLPDSMQFCSFITINAIEESLVLARQLIAQRRKSMRKSGTIKSGQDFAF